MTDTRETILEHLSDGVAGLRRLCASRREAVKAGAGLRKWVIDRSIFLDNDGYARAITKVDGELPEGLVEFGPEIGRQVSVTMSMCRLPTEADRCGICGSKWTIATLADSEMRVGSNPFPFDHRSCIARRRAEAQVAALKAAGCTVEGETGRAHGWTFTQEDRCYWVARGGPLTRDAALRLHYTVYKGARGYYSSYRGMLGDAIRVDGDCTCPEPKGYVGLYHIDTDEALIAFVRFLGAEAPPATTPCCTAESERIRLTSECQELRAALRRSEAECRRLEALVNTRIAGPTRGDLGWF